MIRSALSSSSADGRQTPGPRSTTRKESGFVLIVSLLILVVLTILAVSMFRSFGLQQIMAGNLREKTRAIDAAQAAINFAEGWLTQVNNGNNATTGNQANAGCTSVVTYAANTPSYVCTAPIPTPTTLPWAEGVNYNPNAAYMQVSTGGGLGTFYQVPQFYIQYAGPDSSGNGKVYRITAVGWGGNSAAVAVLQSTYIVSTGVQNLGGP